MTISLFLLFLFPMNVFRYLNKQIQILTSISQGKFWPMFNLFLIDNHADDTWNWFPLLGSDFAYY